MRGAPQRTVSVVAMLLAVTGGLAGIAALDPFPSGAAVRLTNEVPPTSARAQHEPAVRREVDDGIADGGAKAVDRFDDLLATVAETTSSTSTTTPTTPTTAPTTTSTPVPPLPAGEALLPPAPRAAAGERTFTAAFVGDILPHSPLWRQAQRNAGGAGYDFGPMLAPLRPLLDQADLAVCHLETPIAPEGEELSTAPLYGVPFEVVGAIREAGFDRCSTASNHTADRGVAGIDRTIAAFEHYGVAQSGMARTPAEIEPGVFRVAGVAVSHLSYTFSYNGLRLPAGEEWRSATIDPARIVADASVARERGAEVVIVSLHWGTEKVAAPDPFQRDVSAALMASGLVDVIVGHHAHVLQPIESVSGRWVVYGMGNVLSNMPAGESWPASSQDAAVVALRITVGADGAVRVDQPVVHPTWCDRDAGWIVRPVLATLADPTISDGLRARLETSWARTIGVLGAFVPAR